MKLRSVSKRLLSPERIFSAFPSAKGVLRRGGRLNPTILALYEGRSVERLRLFSERRFTPRRSDVKPSFRFFNDIYIQLTLPSIDATLVNKKNLYMDIFS